MDKYKQPDRAATDFFGIPLDEMPGLGEEACHQMESLGGLAMDSHQPRKRERGKIEVLPRDYQKATVDAVFRELETNRSTIVCWPTGTGKTALAGFLAKICREMWLMRGAKVVPGWVGKKILFMAHRGELLDQAMGMFGDVCPADKIHLEQADYRASRKSWEEGGPRVVVASVQSISNPRRLKYFHPDMFGLVICDEAHHGVPSNKTYWTVFKHFWPCRCGKPFDECGCPPDQWRLRWLGITATPDRADCKKLGQVYQTVAYDYPIWSPQEKDDAIGDGWLVPVATQTVEVEDLDYSGIGGEEGGQGDLKDGELENALMQEKDAFHGIIYQILQIANTGGQRRPTLVFTPRVGSAKLGAEIMNRHAEKAGERDWARWLSGDPDLAHLREPYINDFRKKRFQFMFGCDLFTEGFDCDIIRVVAILRPTKSRAKFAQMVGRGTRPLKDIVNALNRAENRAERRAIIRASEKPSVLVIDFVGNAGQHKLITCGDVLGGEMSEEVILRAMKRVKRKGRSDMAIELKIAQEEVDKERAQRRKDIIITSTARVQEVNPFDLLDVQPKREPGWFMEKKPTDKMIEVLEKSGIRTADLSFWEAKTMIQEIIDRSEKKLSTFKQVKLLARFGIDGKDMTFEEASKRITDIADNGWKPLPVDSDD